MFTNSQATLEDLEDDSSIVKELDSALDKPNDFDLGANIKERSELLQPAGEVPDAQEEGYRLVNPMFESYETPLVVLHSLYKAMNTQDIEFSIAHDWTVRHVCRNC